ncbi:HlyD family efflux transporter periplasmic adaptor subunit [Maritimibacter sp. UBA3975]|uniref:efflux RND transporter periplasmic adaptor subunit n=1 Tax=Maritimibacter sp. UBA3975 TaxID=1946833 RepID=UPI000C0B5842|nr:HlyD family efflux transporter periplasmic adaptor subunit [Maritimibacter sp. UBA3975]MAM62108.1 efflux transporter periplasmic adaptor subunit [Maritimibacter sp.]|tara:strand:+ start:1166 stop:2641 length:1476 start_codon:yes stop_codon:yes gene_type:complete
MRFLRRSLTGLFLAALTVTALGFAAYVVRDAVETRMSRESGSMPARERVYSVNVVTVTGGTVAPVLEAFGEVQSRRTLEIRARTGGTVVELGDNFIEGGRVEQGQMLVTIDPTDLEDAVSLARADLAEAEAEVSDAEAALILEQDDLASARRQYELRQTAVSRQQDLLDRGVGLAAELENARLSESSAEQAVLAARSNVNAARARVSSSEIALERARIALNEAERRLAEATITAEFTGALADVAALQGRLVTANEQLATLVDPDALEVSFRLSTAQYARLLDGDGDLVPADVTASLDLSGFNLVATGTIARESAAVGDGQTGRLIFATLSSAPGFRPGDFVTVTIREPEITGVAELPASAVSSSGTVLVLGDEDRLEEVTVTVARRQGDTVLIEAAQLEGREVVEERTPTLGAGIRVRPQRTDPQAGEAAAEAADAPSMIALDDDRRTRLISFVEGNQMLPTDARERILTQLRKPEVPARMVERIESRMGG